MWLWIIAVLAAYFVKGLTGFANTLVFSTITGFGADNVNISPVDLVLGFPANIIQLVKNRKHLISKVWMPLAAMVLVGSIPGTLILKNIDAGIIKIIFGGVVVLIAIEMLLREYNKLNFKNSKVLTVIIGLISGAMCGMFGIGALLVAILGRNVSNSDEFKANISAIFLTDNVFRLILYSIMGIITVESLWKTLIMFPFMLIGLFIGMKCAKTVNEHLAKLLVIILLVITGVVLIINNL